MHINIHLPTVLRVQEVQDEAPKPYSANEGMQGIVALLERSVKTKETRLLMGRLMRQTAQLRGHMTAADLDTFITTYLPADCKSGAYLAGYIKQVTGTHIQCHARANVL
jgi:26S proteasome regulatory subunit N3